MIKLAYKFLPYLLFYTTNLPDNVGGIANGFIVRIKPKYKLDKGIHAHEEVHVKQWYKTLGFHSFLYKYSSKYRLNAEVEAYKEQLKYYLDDRTNLFAKFIVEDYNLDVEQESITQLLKEREE